MGWKNVLQCEKDEFCQTILRHHFPSAHLHGDIRTLDGSAWAGRIDVLTGGFPCQPFSAAGQRRGTDDDRFLWPEMLRVIQASRPTWVVAENVRGLLSIEDGLVFERVCTDLESLGYDVQPFLIPACAVGAPHRRDRIWFIGHAKSDNEWWTRVSPRELQEQIGRSDRIGIAANAHERRREGSRLSGFSFIWKEESGSARGNRPTANVQGEGLERGSGQFGGGRAGLESGVATFTNPPRWERQPRDEAETQCSGWEAREFGGSGAWQESWAEAATRLCRVDDGLPRGLDTDAISAARWRRESLKGYGNAIVPQVAFRIFQAIEASTSV
jgi:DNA (cytosine-5)-methyltransferase 1